MLPANLISESALLLSSAELPTEKVNNSTNETVHTFKRRKTELIEA
ncbi:MAG: hypothetical protein BWY95_02275 [Bacteroidetes bacterium ADurb.BinA104]|jgi:hypothetical protein|nr:MAG: hypothetical protein BWY95_02275 [Bacteroidetes bacterium ADurb.BinA104]